MCFMTVYTFNVINTLIICGIVSMETDYVGMENVKHIFGEKKRKNKFMMETYIALYKSSTNIVFKMLYQ